MLEDGRPSVAREYDSALDAHIGKEALSFRRRRPTGHSRIRRTLAVGASQPEAQRTMYS
jgi:hypothetical protein